MKRSWIQIASLALTAVLAAAVFWQGVRLDALERKLQAGLDELEDVARTEADNAARRVETALQEDAQVITDHALVPTGLDRETRTLTADWTVTLRQWSADTRVQAELPVGGETQTLSLTHQGGGVFSAPVSLPVETESGIGPAAVTVTTGGVSSVESLGGWESITQLLPVHCSGSGGGYTLKLQNGKAELTGWEIYLEDEHGAPAAVHSPMFRLLQNGEMVQALPGQQLRENGTVRYVCTDWQPQPCAAGDELAVTLTCTDSFGLTYTFTLARYQIAEDGSLLESCEESDAYPALTWE